MATPTLFISTGNGMFGRDLVRELAGDPAVEVRAMVRNPAKFTSAAPNVTAVIGDMDAPETLAAAIQGCNRVFHTAPMDEHIATRGKAVIDAAVAEDRRSREAGGPGVELFIYIGGAVDHGGDHLSSLHAEAVDHLKSTGLTYAFVSPNSVMETSLFSMKDSIKLGALFGISGHGKIGMVALRDVSAVTAAVVAGPPPESGSDLLCTGPVGVDMPEVAAAFTEVLGRDVDFYNLPEDEFANLLLSQHVAADREELELTVMCHLRAWGEGKASLVTTTVEDMTGRPATPLAQWIGEQLAVFGDKPSLKDRLAHKAIRAKYGKYILRP